MAAGYSSLGLGFAAVVSFIIVRAIYRLTLHPLARFPGPKLAAVSSLYQAWFDLRPETSYIFRFPELHERYGKLETCRDLHCQLLTKERRPNREDHAKSTARLRHYGVQRVS